MFEETSEIIDISKEKAISREKNLVEDFEQMKEFFEAFDALIMIVDENGRIGFVSPNVDDSTLYKPKSEIIGKTFSEIFPQGQANFFLDHIQKAIKEDRYIELQYHLPIKNEMKWFQSRAFPVKTQAGETKQVITIIRDITEWIKKPIED
jgi:PAS domain S-box-containing protein